MSPVDKYTCKLKKSIETLKVKAAIKVFKYDGAISRTEFAKAICPFESRLFAFFKDIGNVQAVDNPMFGRVKILAV